MRFPDPSRRIFLTCRALIWLASGLAPSQNRRRWRDNWTRQVWHWCQFLAESRQVTRDKKLQLARFCWSAFPAAFWLRFDRDRFLSGCEQVRRSPSGCLGAIGLVLILVTLFSGTIPVMRSFISSPIPQPDRVCVISLNGKFRRVRSETLFDLASAWKSSKLLEDVAPYSWGPATLDSSRRSIPILSARVAPEFFQVLGLHAASGRILQPGDAGPCSTCVVLSNDIWRLQFRSNPSLVGQPVVLDGVEHTVIGILPRNFHLFSPDIGVWTLLDSRSPPFSNFVERIGAVARMRPAATERKLEADLADLTENAGYVFPASMLMVTSGAVEMHRYVLFYWLAVLVAVASATLIVYARSGSSFGRAPLSLRDRMRWWSFFITKAVLLLMLTGVLAWTAVRWGSIYLVGSIHPMTNAIALWLFLAISVAPLSWAIYDQQRRCRVCLQRLGTPIQIGAPGYVLLDWSGTEMVCPDGHGVLYLPDSQANWLERDRWDNLDDSWADLFREN